MAKEEIKKCSHEGHWRSAGISSINEERGIVILVILYCSKCGETMSKNLTIGKLLVPPPVVPSGFGKKGN